MAERRPRVAISGMGRQVTTFLDVAPHVTCRQQFIDLILAADCLPIIIPPLVIAPDEYLECVDGLIIPGGSDLDPALYGQKPHKETICIDPHRDRWEIELVRAALRNNVPILGVCRGMQLLNVALGGTLIQHLPDESHKVTEEFHKPAHEVLVTPGSRVAQALGIAHPQTTDGEQAEYALISVNSIHHQAIERLGEGLEVTATARDGILEAIESYTHKFVVGVQWHPEFLDDPRQKGLFAALAAALHGKSGN